MKWRRVVRIYIKHFGTSLQHFTVWQEDLNAKLLFSSRLGPLRQLKTWGVFLGLLFSHWYKMKYEVIGFSFAM